MLSGAGYEVIRLPLNQGRGAARAAAMTRAMHDWVLCCDATNTLPPDFAGRALLHFSQGSHADRLAAVFGQIEQVDPQTTVDRWKARYLFKQYARQEEVVLTNVLLSTGGVLMRKDLVQAVGGFDPLLRHTEDSDLGERLLGAGYTVWMDPSLKVLTQVSNSLSKVLERYWRWNTDAVPAFRRRAYLRTCWYALKCMAWPDLRRGELGVAAISLVAPHYQAWMTLMHAPRTASVTSKAISPSVPSQHVD